ncbi:MAG TPA: 3-hydroxyacyl-CoA dehydrogenase family protein [Candidatus Binataceae bacterium]|nr:3-hydroxyacyl-CoA dehydrogenase family protein [Candidatus Binataceae bacterium]
MKPLSKSVVILGANGTMGAGAAAVFAGAGYNVVMLARERDKAEAGLEAAKRAARADALGEFVRAGTYGADLERECARASVIFEALAEEIGLKREFFARVDRCRADDSLVATNSSGLSIAEMARGRSDSFRRHFLGIHLYNPPHIIVGTEVIPNPDTAPEVLSAAVAMLRGQLNRKVIVTRDRPAFVGNRVGFKVMNEVAQLAEHYGVAFLDYVVGPQTGRAMAPLATIDLVGWDVHKAIVDNVRANCRDEAYQCFTLPAYIERGVTAGSLGDKTPAMGGFYRREGKSVEVLNPATGGYEPYAAPEPIGFVERMREHNRMGRYGGAMAELASAEGPEAELARRVVMGYVSYALNRVGEVAESTSDVDTIMSFGFNWAPPGAIVDLMGARRAVELCERAGLAVPPAVESAARKGHKLFSGCVLDYGRTFFA